MFTRQFSYLTKKGSLIWSLGAVVFTGFIFATILVLRDYMRGTNVNLANLRIWYFGGAIVSIVGWGVLSFLSYFIALLMLHPSGSSLDITGFLRVSGYAVIPFAFRDVPFIGWLIPIVGVYLWVLACKHGFDTDLEKAVIISLPMIVVYLVVAMSSSSALFPSFGGAI